MPKKLQKKEQKKEMSKEVMQEEDDDVNFGDVLDEE